MNVEDWLKKALYDLESSKYNLKGDRLDVAAFLAQQSAEKALKALYIQRKKELWKIHDLVKLGQSLSAPRIILEACDRLSQHYIATRYPVEAEYTKKDVQEALNDSKKVIEWVKKELRI